MIVLRQSSFHLIVSDGVMSGMGVLPPNRLVLSLLNVYGIKVNICWAVVSELLFLLLLLGVIKD